MINLMWDECSTMSLQLDNSNIRSYGENNHEFYSVKE